jgi:hypothetical protein
MTYENIKVKTHDRGDGQMVEAVIYPFLLPFVEKLALKYPQWTFEEENTNYKWGETGANGKMVKTEITATAFKVMDKREELGTVYVDRYHRGEDRFGVDNFRVAQLRERGNGMKTIHEKKALKHVEKYFGKKDTSEKLQDARDKAQRSIHSVANDLSRKFDWAWNSVNSNAQEFLITKYWEEFSEYAMDKVKATVEFEKMPEYLSQKKAGAEIYEAVSNKNYYLVHIEGLSYAVERPKEGVKLLSSEELPDFLRKGVGMLKLLEDGQIIGGMGLRVDASTFVLLNQA